MMIFKYNLNNIIKNQENAQKELEDLNDRKNQYNPKHYDLNDKKEAEEYKELLKDSENYLKDCLKPVSCENIEWENKLTIVRFKNLEIFEKHYLPEFSENSFYHFYVIGEAHPGHLLIGPIGFSGPNVIAHTSDLELMPPDFL